ncbi:hypothetical protein, partial [Pantoea deleyi]|uniref:hypothetical protein n=1 Tax=Pantoea deleyi TaxID=470932 RepID=UPI001B800B8E
LRGGRPPPDASAWTGNLKLPTAWRAKPVSVKLPPHSRSEHSLAWRAKPAQRTPAAMRKLFSASTM